MENSELRLDAQVTKKVSVDQIESDKNTAAALSKVNSITTSGAEITSLGLSFLGVDPSGHLMKFGQMQKIYCRLRFPDINHGPYLTNYFLHSSETFDPQSKKSDDEFVKLNKSARISMLKYKIAVDVFEI